MGCYLHGLFDEAASRTAILRWASLEEVREMDYVQVRKDAINRLADELERALDLERINSFLENQG